MNKIIAIDFDGCLCEGKWPDIGQPHWAVIDAAIAEQASGAKLILWTCRTGSELKKAVQFCRSCGLNFDAVNENLSERVAAYQNDCRKVSADEYWDDKAVPVQAKYVDPLTCTELVQMCEKNIPVWLSRKVAFDTLRWESQWVMIKNYDKKICNTYNLGFYPWDEYRRTWIAYRCRPVEVTICWKTSSLSG